MTERLLRVSEVAERVSCGRSTVYRAIEEGRLRAHGNGSMVRVPESAIAEWLPPREPRSAGPMPDARPDRSHNARRPGRFASTVASLDDRRARE